MTSYIAPPDALVRLLKAGDDDRAAAVLANLALAGWLLAPRVRGIVPANGDGAGGGDTVNDITFTAGAGVNHATGAVGVLASTLTKQADAVFAKGSNVGAMRAGHAFAADTDYHWFLIRETTTGDVDIYVDTDAAGANVPSGWSIVSRVFSSRSGATAAWLTFTAHELAGGPLSLEYKVGFKDLEQFAANTTRNTVALTVPGGIRVLAEVRAFGEWISVNSLFWFKSTDFTNAAADTVNADLDITSNATDGMNTKHVPTDTSRLIAHRQSNTGSRFTLSTHGYIDRRA